MVFNATLNNILGEVRVSLTSDSMIIAKEGSRGRDNMVVGFTTTCAIIAYHH